MLAIRALTLFWLAAGCGRVAFDSRAGTATDGATGDADADAAGGDDAAPSCEAFDLCDTFEEGIDPVWSVDPDVSIDMTIAHRGGRSARMHMLLVPAGTAHGSRMFETTTLAPVPPEVWVRAWVRMGGLPGTNNRLELISIERDGGGGAGDYVFSRSNATLIYVQPDATTSSTGALPLDTWTCLVFHVVFATAATGSLDLAIDDVPTLDIANTRTNDASTPVDTIAVGPYFSSTNVLDDQEPFDVWVDDVIVHHGPVTCAD